MKRLALFAALLSCSSVETEDGRGGGSTTAVAATTSEVTATGASVASSSSGTGGAAGPLGMNDVSMLVPLPPSDAPTLFRASDPTVEGTPILPVAIYDDAITIPGRPGELGDFYDQLHVVALRFDLCDRVALGPCPEGAEGSLRLVFQPVFGATGVDLGFHAFYTIPPADVPGVVARLRTLAAMRGEPTTSPLGPSQVLATDAAYRDEVRAMVNDLARPSRLMRVTAMGQVVIAAAFRWVFHGIERRNGVFEEMVLPDTNDGLTQDVLLLDQASYRLTPEVDLPAGLQLALSRSDFGSAGASERTAALRALIDVENPLTHTADTVQCASCHVSTVALAHRAMDAGVDPRTLPGAFTSPFDLSIARGASATDDTLIRGFGWVGNDAAISQRVVNETANVLAEIQARFPEE